MSYMNLSIEELHQLLVDGKVTPKELAFEAIERAKKYQPSLNAFVSINELENLNLESFDPNNPLSGIPFTIKDNYSTKGIRSTASSNILENYVPVFDATVVEKLNKAGAINIGKTSMDELALGGTGLNPATGKVNNPYCLERLSGGSSAGSAVSVSAGIVPFSIGSDTGDSVRKPAAYNGIVGFKPTWGRISRFGLFPFACSLDHVAYFTRNVKDAAYVLENLAGYDAKDMSSSSKNVPNYSKDLKLGLKGKRIAVVKEINDSLSDPKVKENLNTVIEKLKSEGAIINEVSIDIRLLRAILPVYLVISCSEATSNDANLDGIKFGPREEGSTYVESIINTRTKRFSELVKRRFIIGSYCLSAANQEKLFIRAQKVRRMICDAVDKILENSDTILFPASGTISPKANDNSGEKLSSNYLIGENHLAIGNFGGYPSITIPSGFVDGMPVGINITGKLFDEQEVLDTAASIEETLGLKNLVAKEYE